MLFIDHPYKTQVSYINIFSKKNKFHIKYRITFFAFIKLYFYPLDGQYAQK